MFGNLIESGRRGAEAKRKGKYFLGALAFYSLLLLAAGVGSIYAYNVSLERRGDYESITFMKFADERPERRAEPERRAPARSNARTASSPARVTVREIAVSNPNLRNRAFASAETPVVSPRMAVEIGNVNVIPAEAGGLGVTGDAGPARRPGPGGPLVVDGAAPPPAPPKSAPPAPAPQPKLTGPLRVSSSVISGKAIEKPAPAYPIVAKQMGAQGSVAVLIVVDERGRVVSAKPSGGHPLLQAAAAQAAQRARFEPTMLGGQPVKVTGVITYNFVLQR